MGIKQRMNISIIIPARYGSTRFPGKPLALLGGKPVLQWVYEITIQLKPRRDCTITCHVATDDTRIAEYCVSQNIPVLMTTSDCHTGTDRAMAATSQLPQKPDVIINLQGDAPFTPPDFVDAMIDGFIHHPAADIVTPIVKLSWDELGALRTSKQTTPFSGTTVAVNDDGRALWFSKNIIPAIRKEESLRTKNPAQSPVFRHIGLYGYTRAALEKFISLPPSIYEELEGLEQLRPLQAGMYIQTVTVDYAGRPAMTGIDSPEDLDRAEKLLCR